MHLIPRVMASAFRVVVSAVHVGADMARIASSAVQVMAGTVRVVAGDRRGMAGTRRGDARNRSGYSMNDTKWPMLVRLPMLPMLPVLLLALIGAGVPAFAQTPQEIIAGADKVRNPGQPFRATDTLTEYVAGKPKDQDQLVVYAKEDPATRQFRNLVRYIEPPRDAGKMALFDNRNLWFYDPSSKASVRISPQQRLIGQASVGDVLTVNFVVDYAGTLLGDETIADAERQQRTCWHLDLKAVTDTAIYNRVEYWVEHGSFHPVKAKFYSDSGRLLKDSVLSWISGAVGSTAAERGGDHRCGGQLTGYQHQVRRPGNSGHSRGLVPARLLPRLGPNERGSGRPPPATWVWFAS